MQRPTYISKRRLCIHPHACGTGAARAGQENNGIHTPQASIIMNQRSTADIKCRPCSLSYDNKVPQSPYPISLPRDSRSLCLLSQWKNYLCFSSVQQDPPAQFPLQPAQP